MAIDPSALSIRITLAKPAQDAETRARDIQALAKANGRVAKELTLALQKIAFQAQKDRFTGQGPFPVAQHRLGVVSGRLRRDIHAETVEATATGYQGRIGAAVEYFAAHEVGFAGTISVRAHTREPSRKPLSGPFRPRKDGKLTAPAAFGSIRTGRGVLTAVSVRAHKRNVKIPARAPLRHAIEDHAARIIDNAISTLARNT